MPAIKNSTVIKHAEPICKVLRERGENLSAEHVAAIIVKTILEESGQLDMLTPESVDFRKEMIQVVSPMITASKNWQTSYLAKTNGVDGKPLMPEAKSQEKMTSGEFA